jgi:hypothetical protein
MKHHVYETKIDEYTGEYSSQMRLVLEKGKSLRLYIEEKKKTGEDFSE